MTTLTETNYRVKLYAAREAAQYFNAKKDLQCSPKEQASLTKRAIEAQREAQALDGNAIIRTRLEKYYPVTRDANDRRRKVSKAVFSYFSRNGVEWRRSFTLAPNTPEEMFWQVAPEVIIL